MEDFSKLLSEFLYDIFGRIIPGGAGIFLFLKCARMDLKFIIDLLFLDVSTLTNSPFFLTTFLVLISYVLGHLISPLSSFLHSNLLSAIFKKKFNVLGDTINETNNPYPSEMNNFFRDEVYRLSGEKLPKTSSDFRRIIYLWYDWIKLNNTLSGDKLSKMRAEYRMLEGLYTSFLISLFIYLFYSIYFSFKFNIFAILCFSFFYLSYTSARLFRTFQFAVMNNYYLIKKSA